MLKGECGLPWCVYSGFILFYKPSIPPKCQFYIPAEILSNEDKEVLIEVQSSLKDSRFNWRRDELLKFIQATDIFSLELGAQIYPVLKPDSHFVICQSWK